MKKTTPIGRGSLNYGQNPAGSRFGRICRVSGKWKYSSHHYRAAGSEDASVRPS